MTSDDEDAEDDESYDHIQLVSGYNQILRSINALAHIEGLTLILEELS